MQTCEGTFNVFARTHAAHKHTHAHAQTNAQKHTVHMYIQYIYAQTFSIYMCTSTRTKAHCAHVHSIYMCMINIKIHPQNSCVQNPTYVIHFEKNLT